MARTLRSRSGAAALPTTFPTPAGALAAARTGARSTVRGAEGVPTQGARRRAAAPPAPLGSLLSAAPGADAGCPTCAGASVTRLAMTLTDGTPVTFVSCHHCETRTWLGADGVALGLAAVLGSATLA